MKDKILGQSIKAARIRHSLTQEELAEKLSISPTHMKHIESEHRKPSIDLLFQIADTLKLSLDSILIEMEGTSSASEMRQQKILELNRILSYCTNQELDALIAGVSVLGSDNQDK